ncbi:MAG: glycosyltransferase family 2 protein [Bacteroidia bacterium]|nr:glycosyltransferase family 2 protein [Bacteroidia bacterium]
MSTTRQLSVIIPVRNEEGNVKPLCEGLLAVLSDITAEYEIIFIDDGSTDGTFAGVKEFSTRDARITGISLSRNFGHQIALLAGMRRSRGEIVISMDGDLQHPPEVIPTLLQKHLEGFDIVNTRRIDASDTGYVKKLTSRWFYHVLNFLGEVQVQPGSADFRLMSRRAVEAFLAIPERDRFTRGLVSWMGFPQAVVEYTARPRLSGRTKYSPAAMLRFALSGITSFSSRPLHLSFYLGIMISLAGLLYAVYAVVMFFAGRTITGWASILVSVLIIGGVILVSLGIIGEYIARIFHEVKSRPLYFIKDETGEQKKNNEQP